MPDWAAYMRRHGFGTDPAGDAARREEMGAARLTGHLTDAQWRELGHLTPEDTRAISDSISRALGSERQPVADHPPVPGHLLTYRHGKAGTEVTCECGRWDGWYNGPRSRRRVLDDHAGHVAAELRAEGPIRVKAERADQHRIIEGEVAEE